MTAQQQGRRALEGVGLVSAPFRSVRPVYGRSGGVGMIDVGKLSAQRIAAPVEAGSWLRQCLEEKGIGPTEAARLLATSRPTFANILAGRKPISLAMARRCGEAFGIDPYVLVRLQMECDYVASGGPLGGR